MKRVCLTSHAKIGGRMGRVVKYSLRWERDRWFHREIHKNFDPLLSDIREREIKK